jgi:hypothetical protein
LAKEIKFNDAAEWDVTLIRTFNSVIAATTSQHEQEQCRVYGKQSQIIYGPGKTVFNEKLVAQWQSSDKLIQMA